MSATNNLPDGFNKVSPPPPCGKKDVFYAAIDNKIHAFIRTENRFFDITAACQPLANGHIDDNGLIVDAIEVSAQEVADLVAGSQARGERLQKIESLLREWIEVRRARLGRAKQKQRFRLRRREVA